MQDDLKYSPVDSISTKDSFMCIEKVLNTLQGYAGWPWPSLFTRWFYTVQIIFTWTVKVLITLQGYTGYSVPSLFTRGLYTPTILYVHSKSPDHTTRLCRMIWTFTIHQWIQHQIQILYMNSEGADHTTSQCRIIGIFTFHQFILHQRKILYEHSKGPDHTTRLWSRSGPSLFTSHFYTNQWLFMCIIKVLITLQGRARRSGPPIFTIGFNTNQTFFPGIVKILITLQGYVGWSGPSLFTSAFHSNKKFFICTVRSWSHYKVMQDDLDLYYSPVDSTQT